MSFIKKIIGKKQETANKKEFSASIEVNQENKDTIKPSLSLHPEEERVTTELNKKYMQNELERLPEIKKNDISINGVYAYDIGDKIEVSFFILNGLEKNIKFEEIPLLLLDKKNQILARQTFDLSGLGEIPVESGRPWKILFDKSKVFTDDIPSDDWKLVIDIRPNIKDKVNIKFENIENKYSDKEVDEIESFIKRLELVDENEVNITTYKIKKTKDEFIEVSLLIRNGSYQTVNIEKLPIVIKDENKEIIASKDFNLKNTNVPPLNAIMIYVTFSKEEIGEKDIDVDNISISMN